MSLRKMNVSNTAMTQEFLESSYEHFVFAKHQLETDPEYMKDSFLGRETLKTLAERAIAQLEEKLRLV